MSKPQNINNNVLTSILLLKIEDTIDGLWNLVIEKQDAAHIKSVSVINGVNSVSLGKRESQHTPIIFNADNERTLLVSNKKNVDKFYDDVCRYFTSARPNANVKKSGYKKIIFSLFLVAVFILCSLYLIGLNTLQKQKNTTENQQALEQTIDKPVNHDKLLEQPLASTHILNTENQYLADKKNNGHEKIYSLLGLSESKKQELNLKLRTIVEEYTIFSTGTNDLSLLDAIQRKEIEQLIANQVSGYIKKYSSPKIVKLNNKVNQLIKEKQLKNKYNEYNDPMYGEQCRLGNEINYLEAGQL